jgi:predicted XRE-type DNA-binding protein
VSTGRPRIQKSSGNVFADLGVAEPDEMLAKSGLAVLIVRTIRERGLTQSEAARLLQVDQPKVSELTRGVLRQFSTERLVRFARLLGHEVRIVVAKPKGRKPPVGRLEVVEA